MKIPAPHRNLQHAIDFARKWVERIGEEWNATIVPPRTREDAARLVAWGTGEGLCAWREIRPAP